MSESTHLVNKFKSINCYPRKLFTTNDNTNGLWMAMSPISITTLPYSILEVENGASEAVVKKAYKKMALKHHPDKNTGDPEAKQRYVRRSVSK